jgi:zeaxanthin glucosyltransferase
MAPPFHSHIRALEAVADILVSRGHRATLLHQEDVRSLIRSEKLGFHALGEATHPPGSLSATLAHAVRPGGPLGILRLVHDGSRATAMLCRDAPDAVRRLGIDAVIADQMEPAGGLVAESLKLPFVSVACALPVNREPDVPLPFLPWSFDPTPQGRKRNRGGERVSDLLTLEHARTIARCATGLGLPGKHSLEACLSPFAQVSQAVAGFDFSRRALPAWFHYVGPLRPADEPEQSLDYAISPRRPFVFASLGTLQGGRISVFRAIAQACKDVDVQLLIAHCGHLNQRQAERLGATWVTDFAPQRAVLARATVAITHAGLNTVLDALSFGVPLLAIPIAFDQPGTAARIAHTGTGERLSPRFLTAAKVRRALERLLADPRYGEHAARIGQEIRRSGGAARAADIIEQVARTRAPVIRDSL